MPADVSGLETLANDLRSAGQRVRTEQTKVVRGTVERIRADAQARAPHGPTGDLKAGIEGTSRGLFGVVRSTVRYAAFVEFGTYKDAPQPHMIPAAEAGEGQYLSDTETAVVKALDL
jgi:HK97 gp10 family phage protein